MAFTESYRDYVLERLGTVRPVRSRKMFGGVGIYADDLFFALIADDVLYLKVDEQTRPLHEAAGATQFGNMPYFELPDGLLDDPDELGEWVERAVEVAARAKKK